MVYLKPLYSRVDRLAQRQSSQFSTKAQQEHVKLLFFELSYNFIKKIRTEIYIELILYNDIRVDPRSKGGHLKILLVDFKSM